jgi:hypothetical protein
MIVVDVEIFCVEQCTFAQEEEGGGGGGVYSESYTRRGGRGVCLESSTCGAIPDKMRPACCQAKPAFVRRRRRSEEEVEYIRNRTSERRSQEEEKERTLLARSRVFYVKRSIEPLGCIKPGFQRWEPFALVNHEQKASEASPPPKFHCVTAGV